MILFLTIIIEKNSFKCLKISLKKKTNLLEILHLKTFSNLFNGHKQIKLQVVAISFCRYPNQTIKS